MYPKKKGSGFSFRKKKAEKEKALAKLRNSFQRYLQDSRSETGAVPSGIGEPSISSTKIILSNNDESSNGEYREPGNIISKEESMTSNRVLVTDDDSSIQPSPTGDSLPQHDYRDCINKNTGLTEMIKNFHLTDSDLDLSDPGEWPLIDDNLRIILISKQPHQVGSDYDYPCNSDKRRFSVYHYQRVLPNKEIIPRRWLVYSKSLDKVFCFCCKLFEKPSSKSTENFISKGTNDWKNLSSKLKGHESSSNHFNCYKSWKELEMRLKSDKTIDQENLKIIKEREEYWNRVLERVVSLVRTLGVQNLALRETNDTVFTEKNGNFLKMLEFLALFDPLMNEHLRKSSENKNSVNYLGPQIQNEIIQLLANAIKDKILHFVQSATYYSIIIDTTPDVSHIEQMAIIVRFVKILHRPTNGFVDCDKEIVKIKEHFLGFVPLEKTSGADFENVIVRELEKMSIPLENMRGQGYDNASNTKGKDKGLQSRILKRNSRAFYVPCSAHSLNLVVNDAASSMESIIFFDLIQRIFVFFSASTQRWSILKQHVSSLTVKPLSDTRWSSRIDALKPLRYQLSEIYESLRYIAEDASLTGTTGYSTRHEADSISKKIFNFTFITSLVIWYEVLYNINVCSKLLQSKEFDLSAAICQMDKTKEFLKKYRNDSGFETILDDAKDIAQNLGIDPSFKSNEERLRRKPRQFDNEGRDELIVDPKQRFKISFYFTILDRTLSSIEERFIQIDNIDETFGFLFDMNKVASKPQKELLDNCLKVELALSDGEEKDIDGLDLKHEIAMIADMLHSQGPSSPIQTLRYIHENQLEEGFPNLSIVLRIILTLPMSVASAERSFSKLKLIKSYVRNSMLQDRLSGLAFLSIESELAESLDIKELISKFAKLKARKVPF